MPNVQPAGSTGVGYERATVPTSSPSAPLPPMAATTIWITASDATARFRARSVEVEGRAVTGMGSLSGRVEGGGEQEHREDRERDEVEVLPRAHVRGGRHPDGREAERDDQRRGQRQQRPR